MPKNDVDSLIGRDAELEAIIREIDSTAERGSNSLVVVTAQAGIGKTALLDAVAAQAHSEGYEFVKCPFDALPNDAKEFSSPCARERLPSLNSGIGISRQGRGLEAVPKGRTATRKRPSPTVVTIDDLDCSQPHGRAAIRALVPQFAGKPVTWVVSRNADEDGQHMAAALDSFGIRNRLDIALRPLTREAARQLASSFLRAPLDPALTEIVDAAEGNPAMITSLAAGYPRAKELERSTDLAVTAYFRELLSNRIERVSPEALRVLEAAAVLGKSFEVDDLASILGMTVSALAQILRPVLAANLLKDAAERIHFQHDCVRRALLAGLPIPVRAAMHREIARLFLEQDGRLVEAAEHLASGARSGDSSTAGIVREAAEAVQYSRPDVAANLTLQALDKYPSGHSHHALLATIAIRSCIRVGPLSRVVSLGSETSLTPLNSSLTAEARNSLGLAHLLQGNVAGAMTAAEVVLAESGLSKELVRNAAAVKLWASLGTSSRNLDDPGAIGPAAEAGGESSSSADEVNVMAIMAWRSGDVTEAIRLGRDAWRSSRKGLYHACNYSLLPSMLIFSGQLSEAADLLETEMSRIDLTISATRKIVRGGMHHAAGEYHCAESEVTAGLELADRIGMTLHRASGWATLTSIAIMRGNLTEGARCIKLLEESHRRDGANNEIQLTALMVALLAEASGDEGTLATSLRNIDTTSEKLIPLLLQNPLNGPFLVRAALSSDFASLAEVTAKTLVDLAERNPESTVLHGIASHALGLLTKSAQQLQRALDDNPRPYLHARIKEDLADLLGGSDAVGLLEDSMQIYGGLGAEHNVSRIRMKLRALGVRTRHWHKRKRPDTGWESLTDRELAIVERVIEGLTNQQIASRLYVSRHTVAFHLRHVFRKLGVHSRMELANLERGGDTM